jgi:hypothetical protein
VPGDDLGFDLGPIFQAVDTAEVLIVRFPFFEQRLLVDLRSNPTDPPVVALLPQASAIEERFRSVKQARPRLPVPDRIISFQWPRHVEVLAAAGVWDRIVRRLLSSGHSGLESRCEAAWREMQQAERHEVMRAIRGDQRYETLWERSAGGAGA